MRKRVLHRQFFRRMLEWIVRRPVWTILIIVLVTFFFAWQIPALSIRTSIYDLVIQDLPETARYNEFKKIFGSDEILRVVIKGEMDSAVTG